MINVDHYDVLCEQTLAKCAFRGALSGISQVCARNRDGIQPPEPLRNWQKSRCYCERAEVPRADREVCGV